MTLDQDINWLKKLNSEIWERYYQHQCHRSWYLSREKRNLTQKEYVKVKSIIKINKLTCQMCSTSFGFTYGITIFEDAPVLAVQPEAILLIGGDQIPQGHIKDHPYRGTKLDYLWKELSPFTHSEENKGRLKFYKMEAPKERSYYDY